MIDIEDEETEESPLKKSRTSISETKLPAPDSKSYSTSTTNIRLQRTKTQPPKLANLRLERENSSVLDQLVTDAQDTVDRFLVAYDSASSSSVE